MIRKLTYENIFADIARKNYVEVPLNMSRETLERSAEYFLEFLTLPQNVKDDFQIIADENDRGSEAGYALRKKK